MAGSLKASQINSKLAREYIISHFGVPGMKWGVRRRSGSNPSSETTRTPNTFKNKPQNRKMSDGELRRRINRMTMEKQYKELANPKKSPSFVNQLMADAGKQAARSIVNKAVTASLQLALESAAKNSKSPSSKAIFTEMAALGKKKKK